MQRTAFMTVAEVAETFPTTQTDMANKLNEFRGEAM